MEFDDDCLLDDLLFSNFVDESTDEISQESDYPLKLSTSGPSRLVNPRPHEDSDEAWIHNLMPNGPKILSTFNSSLRMQPDQHSTLCMVQPMAPVPTHPFASTSSLLNGKDSSTRLVGIPAPLGTDWYGIGAELSDDDGDDDIDIDDAASNPDKSKKKRKRQKSNNPDAELIAHATEENLKILNLDPNSKEGKKQRRRIRNRMSAQLHRERKKLYISYLEGLVRGHEDRIIKLNICIEGLQQENQSLRCANFSSMPMLPMASQPLSTIGPSHLNHTGTIGPNFYAGASSSSYVPNFEFMQTVKEEQSSSPDCSSSPPTDGEEDSSSVSSGSDTYFHSSTDSKLDSQEAMESGVTFGSGFSLFSVVCMLGLTVFGNNPLDLSSSSFVPTSTDPFSSLHLATSMQSWDPRIDSSGSSSSSSSTDGLTGSTHHSGRVLLSMPGEAVKQLHLPLSLSPLDEAGPSTVSNDIVQYSQYAASHLTLPSVGYQDLSNMALLSSHPHTDEETALITQSLSDDDKDGMSTATPAIIVPLQISTNLHSLPRHSAPVDLLRNTALWKYQDRVLHIFPHNSTAATSNSIIRPARLATTKRRHLRARTSLRDEEYSIGSGDDMSLNGASEKHSKQHSESSVHLDSALDYALELFTGRHLSGPDSEPKRSNRYTPSAQHLLGAPTDNWHTKDSAKHTRSTAEPGTTSTSSGSSSSGSSGVVTLSHVLLTEGRVLLDPGLTFAASSSGPVSANAMSENNVASSARSVGVPLGGPIAPTHSTAFTFAPDPEIPLTSALSTWRAPQTASGMSRDGVPPVYSLGMGKGVVPDMNMLLMLLPASAVRWGKSWSDSAVYTTERLMSGLNVTNSSADGAEDSGDTTLGDDGLGQASDDGSLWIEIGCSVLRAQLVRNVTLT